MTKRNTTDPLLRAFLDAYGINLLSIPRRDAKVGDAYIETSRGVSGPGELRFLLKPAFTMPKINEKEQMTDIATVRTRALELAAGASLLQRFFGAIGLGGAAGKVKAEYEKRGAGSVRFGLKQATRDSVDPFALAQAIKDCRLDESNSLVKPGNRYYIAVGVVRSASISVAAEDNDSQKVAIDADALEKAVSVEGKLMLKHDATDELTYEGSEALAFGVELMEVLYDSNMGKLSLDRIPDPVEGIRDVRDEEEKAKIVKDARKFIGDSVDGDVFLKIIDD